MVKVYLDANILMDILTHRQEFDINSLGSNRPLTSTLSVSIAAYAAKITQPDKIFKDVIDQFDLIPLSVDIVYRSMRGPESDFEDNSQLNTASNVDADLFVTRDKALLKKGVFGKTQIIHPKDLSIYL